jgi:dolichol-phosphate mannosyltransferase
MKTLVVLPTYDEADNIAEVLTRVRKAVPFAAILVVDDSSPDGTAGIARSTDAALGGIDVLTRAGKLGLGSAYRDGFVEGLRRGFDILVEMDADLSHDPAALPDLLGAIDDGADLAVGSRYVAGGSIERWTARRRALSRWGNRYAAWALALPLADATSGFRAYRAEVVAALDLRSVRADGYGFQIEMAHRVARMGGRIVEVPIAFADRARGRSKMSLRIIAEALLLVTWWGVTAQAKSSGASSIGLPCGVRSAARSQASR